MLQRLSRSQSKNGSLERHPGFLNTRYIKLKFHSHPGRIGHLAIDEQNRTIHILSYNCGNGSPISGWFLVFLELSQVEDGDRAGNELVRRVLPYSVSRKVFEVGRVNFLANGFDMKMRRVGWGWKEKMVVKIILGFFRKSERER